MLKRVNTKGYIDDRVGTSTKKITSKQFGVKGFDKQWSN